MECKLLQNLAQQAQLGRMIKLLTGLLLLTIVAGCAGLHPSYIQERENVFLTQRELYVNYALALHTYHQKNHERSLELSLELAGYEELHPYIGRLIIRNRLELEQWDEIEEIFTLLDKQYEDVFLKGKFYYKTGKFDRAHDYLTLLTYYPRGPRALETNRMLLEIYTIQEEWDNYSETAMAVLKHIPTGKEHFFRSVLFTLMDNQQPAVASEFVKSAFRQMSLDEDSLLFYTLIMIRFFEEEQVAELVEPFLERLISKYPVVLEVYLEYPEITRREYDPEKMEERLLRYLEDYPEKVLPHYIHFLIKREETQHLKEVAREYENYIKEDEELTKVIGIHFFNQKKHEKARYYLEYTREKIGPHPQINMFLLGCALETEDISPQQDWKIGMELISLQPKEQNGYFLLHRLYRLLPEEKRHSYREEYMENDIKSPHYYRYGASLFVADTLLEEALEFIEKGLEVYPSNEDLLVEKTFILYKKGSLEKAEEISKTLIEQETSNPFVYNNLAYLWAEMEKNLEQALEYAYKSLEMAPEEPSILDTVGWLYFLKENYNQAEYYLEKAGEKMLEYKEQGIYTSTEVQEVVEHLVVLYETTEEEEKLEHWQTILEDIKQ